MNIFAILSDITCGEACWEAKENFCKCSCGGANHGIKKRNPNAFVNRTSKIDGVMYELKAVGSHQQMMKDAHAINSRVLTGFGWDVTYCRFKKYTKTHLDSGASARVKYASASQMERWAELKNSKWGNNTAILWVTVQPPKSVPYNKDEFAVGNNVNKLAFGESRFLFEFLKSLFPIPNTYYRAYTHKNFYKIVHYAMEQVKDEFRFYTDIRSFCTGDFDKDVSALWKNNNNDFVTYDENCQPLPKGGE